MSRPSRGRRHLPVRPSQSHPVERSLDDSDFNTNPMPKSPIRPAVSPPQKPRVERSDEIARPLPAETCAAPAGLLGSPVIRDAVKAHTDTPVQFPVSNERVRPPVASPRVDPDDGIDRTRAFFPGMMAAAGRKSILQFFNNSIGEWCFLAELDGGMMVLGRSTFQGSDASREGLSEEHVRIGIEGDELYVEPLESLNGVYRRLQPNRREELTPHTRFRIGRHVLEFRFAAPAAAIAPLRADDGEVFQSRVLAPLGFVDLIGPDGRPYLSFPVTKREERGTRIGRAGVECDIALAGDEWVSQRHARLWCSDGKCWIEDQESTNGTFLIITGRTPLRRGTARVSGHLRRDPGRWIQDPGDRLEDVREWSGGRRCPLRRHLGSHSRASAPSRTTSSASALAGRVRSQVFQPRRAPKVPSPVNWHAGTSSAFRTSCTSKSRLGSAYSRTRWTSRKNVFRSGTGARSGRNSMNWA